MLIFVLLILEQGEPRLELAFRELTSCLEYKTALVHQNVSKHAIVMPKTRHFDAYCEPRLVPVSDVGTKLLLRDPPKKRKTNMPYGKGTYGSKVGRPPKKKKAMQRKPARKPAGRKM